MYTPIDQAVYIVFVSSSVIVLHCSTSPPNIGAFGSNTPLLTICLELVLWKRSCGPWDHFMFLVNSWC